MIKKLRQFWRWIWHSNSLLSWIVNFLLAFIIVRFAFYPLLGIILGTSLPLVVIESGSMEHFGTFEEWWNAQEDFYEEFEITEADIIDWPFKNGLNQGDIAVIRKRDFDSLKIGDVIVFRPPSNKKAIIHRIVGIEEEFVETKGDANVGQIGIEKKIKPGQIEGIAIIRIPFLGWIKLVFVQKLLG